jgi:hypothetical protein
MFGYFLRFFIHIFSPQTLSKFNTLDFITNTLLTLDRTEIRGGQNDRQHRTLANKHALFDKTGSNRQ